MVVEPQRADGQSMQANDLVLKEAEHAFDLMVATLVNREFRSRRCQDLELSWLRDEILEAKINPLRKPFHIFLRNFTIGFDAISLRYLVLWQRDPARPLSIVG